VNDGTLPYKYVDSAHGFFQLLSFCNYSTFERFLLSSTNSILQTATAFHISLTLCTLVSRHP